MRGRIVWERLICLAGIALGVCSYVAVDKLGAFSHRGPVPDVIPIIALFQMGIRFGLVAAILGGIGWVLAVRERNRLAGF